MQNVEYKGWLKSLKVGDMVAMNIGTEEQVRYVTSIITDMSPEGRITTLNKYTFNPDGQEYRSLPWGRKAQLLFLTDEIFNQIERDKKLNRVKKFNFENCSEEQLEKVLSVVDEADKNYKIAL